MKRQDFLSLAALLFVAWLTVTSFFSYYGLGQLDRIREPGEPWKLTSVVQRPALARRHKQLLELSDRNVSETALLEGVAPEPKPPGEMGAGVQLKNLSRELQEKVKAGWQLHAFNQYASDKISLYRSLPDPRDPACKSLRYRDNLPETSLVICFHNEAWSTLVRTVHSALRRSPPHLLREVIMVDDFSDFPYLHTRLENYMARFPKVQIIRLKKREGLIRARLTGAAVSTAPVITFLDSHCECTDGWLEPLLDRIAENPSNVVSPVIDVINDNTFEYGVSDYSALSVGGFDWTLQFNWHPVPERERKRRKHNWEPLRTPTMAGGLFSIDRAFFEKLGTYDSGFDIWGGENLELSFKTWMCGGTLEIVPCSRVGHVFRKRSPYRWRSGVNVLRRNTIRLAKVWLDDYAKHYYDRIGNKISDAGDVEPRRALRRRLKCQSFGWYLDTIYPELYVPGETLAKGELRNLGGSGLTCMDMPIDRGHMKKPMQMIACHGDGGNQLWMLTPKGEIRRDEACLDYDGRGEDVFLYPCHGSLGNQQWVYNLTSMSVFHVRSQKCMAMTLDHRRAGMEKCDGSPRQRWKFGN
ncbi:putative polypeptide N-acetylgalactosaminyltransferase 9 [Ornithodoros turicata]|uniref:putative polypeptide N-acetylgalactosaminyltransferase 9 n=1 Tax=Ornithodoros turicata TaxID=34597 RepID=UPI0031399288